MFVKLKKAVFPVHLFAATALIIWILFPLTWPVNMPSSYWIKQVAENLGYAVVYTINTALLSPKLLTKRRLGFYIISVIVLIILMVKYNGWMQDSLHIDATMAKVFHPYVPDHHMRSAWTILMCLIVLGFSNVTTVVKKLQAHELAIQVSEKERISAELSFLKAQINPHFFFNTLHTIYALTDTDPSSAKESLYTLSHMMRYVIYETKQDVTTLKKEVKFILDYISLMRTRIDSSVEVGFTIPDKLRDINVAPMLFLPFIENAFKHGISARQASYIFVEISEAGGILKFTVRNSIYKNTNKELDEEYGIGIANTKRRLDLLYPGKYTLVVNDDANTNEYLTILTLNTNAN